jgi:hypothetical protein
MHSPYLNIQICKTVQKYSLNSSLCASNMGKELGHQLVCPYVLCLVQALDHKGCCWVTLQVINH